MARGRDQERLVPACQSIFLTKDGSVVMQGQPLTSGMADIPAFDREGLIRALRIDQAGKAHSRNSLPLHGKPASCDTMSISTREKSLTGAATMRNTSKVTQPWMSDRRFGAYRFKVGLSLRKSVYTFCTKGLRFLRMRRSLSLHFLQLAGNRRRRQIRVRPPLALPTHLESSACNFARPVIPPKNRLERVYV